MIKEIKIENFKSIQSLNLELGRLNVFIGANGSGKSNILEGIAMGSAALNRKFDSEFLYSRGIRKTDISLVKSGFNNSSSTEPIFIGLKFDDDDFFFYALIDTDKKRLFAKGGAHTISHSAAMHEMMSHYPDNLPTDFDWQGHDEKKNIHKSHLNDFLIYAPENYFLRRFEEDTQIQPLGVRGEGLFSHIIEISKEKPEYFAKINQDIKLLDWFEGFEIPNDLMSMERRIKIKDQFLKEGVQYIDQRSANEGFLYLLFYLTLFISDETPKFFAIDNIDNAMNPKLGSELIRVLTKLAKEHDKQTILTTHNPSVLDGLDLSDDEQRLFVISRNKSGHTQAIRVPYKESDERLSTRFIRGAIGGLPKNF